MLGKSMAAVAALGLFLGSAQARTNTFFVVPVGLGNPMFGYGYGGLWGGGWGGGWGWYPGGINTGYFPRAYGWYGGFGGLGGYGGYPGEWSLVGAAYAGWTLNSGLAAQARNGYGPGLGISYVAYAGKHTTTATAPISYCVPSQPGVIDVRLPADAELWFNGRPSAQTGTHRSFTTPPLEKGQSYNYMVRARWMHNGKAVEESKRVYIYCGGTAEVTFFGVGTSAVEPGGVPGFFGD